MLFSKLIVLTGLLVSSIIASPVAAEDRADFPRRSPEGEGEGDDAFSYYWVRDLASRSAAQEGKDGVSDGEDAFSYYWARDSTASLSNNCEKTSKGTTFCWYTNSELKAFEAAHPGYGPKMGNTCFKTSTKTYCEHAAALQSK